MECLLQGLPYVSVSVYIDDILISGHTEGRALGKCRSCFVKVVCSRDEVEKRKVPVHVERSGVPRSKHIWKRNPAYSEEG